MSMGGTLELIQSFYNPEIIDASDSSLKECNREKLTPRHNRQHNDGKFTSLGSLLGLQVKLSNGIAANTTIEITNNRGF